MRVPEITVVVLAMLLGSGVQTRAVAEIESGTDVRVCRLVLESTAGRKSDIQSVCVRSVSAEVCKSLSAPGTGVTAALSQHVLQSEGAVECHAQDCVLDVAYPSESAHCQGVSLTRTRSNAPESSTQKPDSAAFLNAF